MSAAMEAGIEGIPAIGFLFWIMIGMQILIP
jgi:hypothetical protein